MNTSTRTVLTLVGLLGLVSLTGCQDRLRAENDALFNENRDLRSRLEQVQGERDSLSSEAARLRAEMDAARAAGPAPSAAANSGFAAIPGVETGVSGGNIYVRVPGDVLFDSGKVDLKTSAKRTLEQIAGVINSDYAGQTIRVEGYTDTDPIRRSRWTDNLELSLQRAAAVTRFLNQAGVDAARTYAAGFGEHRARESKAKSRRVEIVVVTGE